MNLANKITLLRIILVPVFMIFLLVRVIPHGEVWAATVFIFAAITDSLDGYVARKNKDVTRLGKLIDPLADKLLITAAMISLVALGTLSPWVAFLIIGREFAVTGLRLIAAVEGVMISANNWGKAKTIAQIVMIVAIILEMALKSGIYPSAGWLQWLIDFYPASLIASASLLAAVVLTVYSGFYYFYQNKHLIKLR